jgi:hypothetical protein
MMAEVFSLRMNTCWIPRPISPRIHPLRCGIPEMSLMESGKMTQNHYQPPKNYGSFYLSKHNGTIPILAS